MTMKPKLQRKLKEVQVMVLHVSLAESAERVIHGAEGMKTKHLWESQFI